jgi:hypothetical protein
VLPIVPGIPERRSEGPRVFRTPGYGCFLCGEAHLEVFGVDFRGRLVAEP